MLLPCGQGGPIQEWSNEEKIVVFLIDFISAVTLSSIHKVWLRKCQFSAPVVGSAEGGGKIR